MVYSMFLVYLFGIWAFLRFQDHFLDPDGTELCQNLLQCTIVTLHVGLRKSDVGDGMFRVNWGDPEFIAFMLMYWLIIITVMMNIIFGIIIDTFAELRSRNNKTDADIMQTCFICSHDRQMFHNTPNGFDGHKKYEHNMWKYLLFIIYIKRKEATGYTGPESYVREKLDRLDLTWFPIGKALSLHEQLKRENEMKNHVNDVVEATQEELHEVNQKVTTTLASMEQGLRTIDAKVSESMNTPPGDILARLDRIERLLNSLKA
eukprot:c20248_g1_i2.p1 GENE.c20248_g1_i2~~c20248_g1_i2.p1  ORF type:complete len:261 (-),score=64.60 c20248_g1_i2:69-851(-)